MFISFSVKRPWPAIPLTSLRAPLCALCSLCSLHPTLFLHKILIYQNTFKLFSLSYLSILLILVALSLITSSICDEVLNIFRNIGLIQIKMAFTLTVILLLTFNFSFLADKLVLASEELYEVDTLLLVPANISVEDVHVMWFSCICFYEKLSSFNDV